MRAGFMLPTLHPYGTNVALAEVAIDAGFESLWLPDHLLGIYPPELWKEISLSALLPDPDAWLDPFIVAGMLSQRFSVPLATGVTDSVRRRPADIARSMLTLHHANQAGFILGIGAGERESTEPFGYDFDKPVAKLEGFIAELLSLLATGRMPEGPGRTGIPLQSAAGRPQIWVAAHGPRMQRLAALYADGWLPLGLQPEAYASALKNIRETACAAGRTPPVASMVAIVMLSDSRERLLSQIQQCPLSKMLVLFAGAATWRKYGLEHPAGPACRGFVDVIPHAIDQALIRDSLARVPTEMFEEFVLLGTAEQVSLKLEQWISSGLEHVVIANYSGIAEPIDEIQNHAEELRKLPGLLARR